MAAGGFQDIRQILSCWDKVRDLTSDKNMETQSSHIKGTMKERQAMLEEFLSTCESMTGPELEAHFNDCSSLFLARLTAWLRIT